MKISFKNFKQISATRIKTYAALILMYTLSFEAMASATEEMFNSEAGMIEIVEASFNEEMLIESWMLMPFEANVAEAVLEMDLTLECWMLMPFEANVAEAVLEMDLTLESWMTLPFETNFIEE